MSDDRIYKVAVGLIPKVGGRLARLLVSYTGSPEQIFKVPKGKLQDIPGIGKITAESISDSLLKEAEKQIELAEKTNTRIIFYTDKDYPERLRHIPDSPAVLYYRGHGDLNARRVLAVVGTRNITPYGKQVTSEIISGIKKYRPLILSGLAYGVDIAAHKASLEGGLPTVGVMASGADIIYPSAHKEIALKMCSEGGILTEYPFATKPEAPRFPARNRIIAGMADAVMVVEAAPSGGALITAEMANGYNREVFAVPGTLHQQYSEGCNLLIRNHKANIYTRPEDLEYILNWEKVDSNTPTENKPDFSSFSKEEQAVLTSLSIKEGTHIDDISWKSDIPLSRLASIILNLEFQGMVKSLPGKKFKLLK